MRSLMLLASLAIAAPAAAQWTVEVGPVAGPNARAAQPLPGPNARAAERPVGPNGAIAKKRMSIEAGDGEASYATCGKARAARATPIYRGEPGYARRLDPDGDGRACHRSPELR